jgi:hypothetical protein
VGLKFLDFFGGSGSLGELLHPEEEHLLTVHSEEDVLRKWRE